MFKAELSSTIVGKNTIAKILKLPALFPKLIVDIIAKYGWEVVKTAQTVYLSGAALNVRSGLLRRSVKKNPQTGAFKRGTEYYVKVGTNVSYGRFWEEGFMHRSGKFMQPRKWLEPSFNDVRPRLIIELKAIGGRLV